jgi:hypothetical protein
LMPHLLRHYIDYYWLMRWYIFIFIFAIATLADWWLLPFSPIDISWLRHFHYWCRYYAINISRRHDHLLSILCHLPRATYSIPHNTQSDLLITVIPTSHRFQCHYNAHYGHTQYFRMYRTPQQWVNTQINIHVTGWPPTAE